MSRTIMLIHGAWVTPLCWRPFHDYLNRRGYQVLVPAWPGKERSVADIRKDPAALAGLGGAEIIQHYTDIARRLPEPPILIGHSFGGLFVQVMLSQGIGIAGVAIDSAPPKGILATQPSAFRAVGGVVANPANRRRVVHWTFDQFRYAFVHTLPEEQARHAYDTQVVPETGRIFFQGALSGLHRRSPFTVDFKKPDRAPLLLIAGEHDRIVPAALNRANFRRYRHSPALTEFIEFPGRTHWIISQPGWEEVAAYVTGWLESNHRRTTAPR